MNNDIDALVSGINESKSLMDIKKKGGIKRLIVNNFMFFELTLSLMSLGEVLTLINKKCGVDIEYNYCSRILNQIRKTKLTPSVNEKKLLA
ncbi:TPA: hypothetical protein R4229_004009, partial [Morganella morganii]|nr:hypothetical protein [Morganella morganii]